VQNLWTTGQPKKMSPAIRPDPTVPTRVDEASRRPSLDRPRPLHRITPALDPQPTSRKEGVNVHRFEETIGGRTYQIEVTPVSNRWRAQIRRTPGMPTALMPFYGQTPDEAAQQLSRWLILANQRQNAPAVALVVPAAARAGTV
jgi:hypothetical protein